MSARAVSLIREARRLDGEARVHKGEVARHRAALQGVRARQAAIEQECAELGITVTYHPIGEGTHPWPKPQSSTSRR
jgi:hypothetical protein